MTGGESGGGRTRPFRVGGARIRPDLNRITTAGGETVPVEPRVMEVLVHLARHAGRVVSRESLMAAVWGETVVGEKALTRAVWSLRQALGDDPKRPAAIETIRKGGYRLIAPVEWEEDGGEGGARAGKGRRLRAAVVVAALLLAALPLLWRAFISGGGERAAPPVPRTAPFTSYLGREYTPRFSPDGARVVFAWDGPEGSDFDIYVKQKNTETPLRLTGGEANDNLPDWSADGRTVYFVRQEADLFSICSVPAIGGDVRTHYVTTRLIWNLDASPAGGELVFSERCSTGTAFRVALFETETGERRWITDPPPSSRGDFYAVFSPEGKTVAFSRCDPINFHRIHTVKKTGGPASSVGGPLRQIQGIVFLDEKELLVASLRAGRYALRRLDLDDGAWTGVPTQAGSIWFPDVSRDGESLVYESARYDLSIYAVDLTAEEPRVSGEPVIESTRWEDEPRFSPDGSRIAFVSNRSGFPELWMCGADGSEPLQLTGMRAEALLSPCWSPDGERLAFFASRPGGERGVYTVEVSGGAPRPLRRDGALYLPSAWSADGRFLYVDSNRDGFWRVWKIAGETAEPEIAIPGEASRARESADGRTVYYGRVRETGVWKAPVSGGAEERVLSAGVIDALLWGNWDLAGERIYFCDAAGIAVYDPAEGEPRRLVEAPGVMQLGLTVSPDEERLLFARYRDLEVDLVLMDGFR